MREAAQALLCEHFGPFGRLVFPYHKMGKVDSFDLFGSKEMELFAIYWKHAERYNHVVDIGANLGLHSILMAKLGWKAIAYEPDPEVYRLMRENIDANDVLVGSSCVAISDQIGEARFTRVVNNLTGSHLTGDKEPYGPTDEFMVTTLDAKSVLTGVDFAKIDCEGHEAVILKCCDKAMMEHLEILAEIGNRKNAAEIYEHFTKFDVPIWAQRLGWAQVKSVQDMPIFHKEGNVFIGHRSP